MPGNVKETLNKELCLIFCKRMRCAYLSNHKRQIITNPLNWAHIFLDFINSYITACLWDSSNIRYHSSFDDTIFCALKGVRPWVKKYFFTKRLIVFKSLSTRGLFAPSAIPAPATTKSLWIIQKKWRTSHAHYTVWYCEFLKRNSTTKKNLCTWRAQFDVSEKADQILPWNCKV